MVTAICVFVLFFVFVVWRGDRLLKEKNRLDEHMVEIYGEMELFEDVHYQGGFPPIPKPSRMTIGITESELVLYNKAGENGRIEYDRIKKADRFTTKHDRKYKFGMIAYGPIAILLNRPTFRNFFTMEYIDVDNERNNLLVIVKNKEMAENLLQAVRSRIKKKKK
jgi:hypothetical protein